MTRHSYKAAQVTHQKGAALVLVLLLVAVISVLAVTAGEKTHQLQLRLTMQTQQQGILREQSVLIPSVIERYFNAIQNSSNSHPKHAWQQRFSALLNQSQFSSQLVQQPPCFNINSLDGMQYHQLSANSIPLQQLMALLENIKTPSPDKALEQIIDIQRRLNTQRDNPVSAKNALKRSLGWPKQQWEQASPFLCFLPSKNNRWNINGFDKQHKPLLKALLMNKLDDHELDELIKDAYNEGFQNNHAVWQHESVANKEIPGGLKLQLRLKSEYYWLNLNIKRSLSQHKQWLFLQQQNNTLKKLYSYRM